jgi:hypothetical protein
MIVTGLGLANRPLTLALSHEGRGEESRRALSSLSPGGRE